MMSNGLAGTRGDGAAEQLTCCWTTCRTCPFPVNSCRRADQRKRLLAFVWTAMREKRNAKGKNTCCSVSSSLKVAVVGAGFASR